MVKLGLIGRTLGHSFSAEYFECKFKKMKIEGTYDLFPLPSIEEFDVFIKNNFDIKGFNVTIPYKEEIIPFLNTISKEAKEIGAVNVVRVKRETSLETPVLEGFNTDWIGFRDSVLPLLRKDIKKALILGTGGASKAVEYALKHIGLDVDKVSRNPQSDKILSYNELTDEIIKNHLLIVNTTPLGMYPDNGTFPDIPYQWITKEHICYDLVYNPEITEFMKKCDLQGASVKNGYEMLSRQAEAAWNIWEGEH